MPYNKGDFTQQGVNGDVSALVRLNDKRVVKMVLSSDDESSNVDVQGTVYDYLNGETYPLGGTTPTGTITITENGDYDVSEYRSRSVSVSGGANPIVAVNNVTLQSFESAYFEDYVIALHTQTNELPGFSNLLVTMDNETFILYPSINNNVVVYSSSGLDITEAYVLLYFHEEAPKGFEWYIFTGDTEPTTHTVSVTIINPMTAVLLGVAPYVIDDYNGSWTINLNSANISNVHNANYDSETGIVTLIKRYAYYETGIM